MPARWMVEDQRRTRKPRSGRRARWAAWRIDRRRRLRARASPSAAGAGHPTAATAEAAADPASPSAHAATDGWSSSPQGNGLQTQLHERGDRIPAALFASVRSAAVPSGWHGGDPGTSLGRGDVLAAAAAAAAPGHSARADAPGVANRAPLPTPAVRTEHHVRYSRHVHRTRRPLPPSFASAPAPTAARVAASASRRSSRTPTAHSSRKA